jgi:hypothetical protein
LGDKRTKRGAAIAPIRGNPLVSDCEQLSIQNRDKQNMKIHEYQAKEILRRYGVPVPDGAMATTVEEAETAAKTLFSKGNLAVVVKAQIHAGGRGKGGGVKVTKTIEDANAAAKAILGMQLVTHQTGPSGQKVQRLLIEAGSAIERELYLGLVLDRATAKIVFMASQAGGMEIEKVAKETPDLIYKETIEPALGLQPYQARRLAFKLGLEKKQINQAVSFMMGLYKAYVESDGDQSVHHDQGRKPDGSGLQDQLRRQRDVPAQGPAGAARPGGGRPAGGAGVEVQPELHQAGRQHCVHGERRRVGDGDDGHHQLRGRKSGELSGCGRKRQPGADRECV